MQIGLINIDCTVKTQAYMKSHKTAEGKRARLIHVFEITKQNLFKVNAAIWFNNLVARSTVIIVVGSTCVFGDYPTNIPFTY